MLTGDEGARRLVARYPAHGVEVDDPGVLIDVDTQDDLIALRGGAPRRGVAARPE
jgi:molybdenum cofactor cytidylyltransferase